MSVSPLWRVSSLIWNLLEVEVYFWIEKEWILFVLILGSVVSGGLPHFLRLLFSFTAWHASEIKLLRAIALLTQCISLILIKFKSLLLLLLWLHRTMISVKARWSCEFHDLRREEEVISLDGSKSLIFHEEWLLSFFPGARFAGLGQHLPKSVVFGVDDVWILLDFDVAKVFTIFYQEIADSVTIEHLVIEFKP